MKKFLVVTLFLGLFLIPALAGATVLTFDDLTQPSLGGDPITNGYGGFNWANMYYLDPDLMSYPSPSGYNAGQISGNVAFNAFARVALVTGGTFDFNGVYLTGAWNDGLNIGVRGLLGGVSVYYQEVVVSSTAPTWFDFNYSGIDQLVFESWGGTDNPNYGGTGTHFAMDNFTVNGVSVPEPSTLLLLGSGLLGIVAIGRKKII